ncbi:MAG: NAD(P)H-dependent oxidoreductase [Abditibacteriota bacterium]|nr:NAD(P)H-dependent oxidoreductase [Abditibacteriota bacterium]
MKHTLMLAAALIAAAILTAALAGCAGKSRAPQKPVSEMTKDTKVLVVYFSWSGNSDKLAHWIAEETGGDLIRVLTREEYPKGYEETAERAKKEQDKGIRPEITVKLTPEELKKYDTVFIGFPVWWYDLPMPMWTFLENNDLQGKTLIPFFSHEGSSNGAGSLKTIEKLAKGAKVKSGDALSVRGGEVPGAEKETREWVKKLGYAK